MKRVFAVLFILFVIVVAADAQLEDDFNDGDFVSNPRWYGDTQDFIVNDKYQLQLDAPDAGNSRLFTIYNAADSMEWGMMVNLDFNPSNSNKLRIFLMLDIPNIEKSSGYFVEIGENGNDDNLKFFELDKGVENLIAEGEIGLFSTPFETKLKISKKSSGFWLFQIQSNSQYYKEDFEVYNDKFLFDTAYFLLDLHYSKTRKDKFIFDDIYIKTLENDTEAPKLIDTKLLDKTKVFLTFDEELDEESVLNKANYTIDQSDAKPSDIIFSPDKANQVLLNFEKEFESGVKYKISVRGLKDLRGNEITESVSAYFFLLESPDFGDLVINELLFNPNKGANDFVELINISNKFLNLKGLKISNLYKENKAEEILPDVIIKKGEIICISSDTNSVINNYFVPDSAHIIQNKLPPFDDDEGNVSLYITRANTEIMIDSFDYSDKMHSSFITDDEGLSLERINPQLNTNDRFNWTSSSTFAGGATPGYKNSAFADLPSANVQNVVLKNNVFSPNNDGIDDELVIEYNFDKAENYANFYIFDSRGRLVTQLINNETLGKKGIIVWDGFKDSSKTSIGIYLLYYKIIDTNSNVIEGKKTIVLADYIK